MVSQPVTFDARVIQLRTSNKASQLSKETLKTVPSINPKVKETVDKKN